MDSYDWICIKNGVCPKCKYPELTLKNRDNVCHFYCTQCGFGGKKKSSRIGK